MDWYRVVKTINGRRYLYLQKTYRVGKSVKTLNRYVGPATGPTTTPRADTKDARRASRDEISRTYRDIKEHGLSSVFPPTQHERTVDEHRAALSAMRPSAPEVQPYDPNAKPRRADYTAEEWKEYLRGERLRKREYDDAMSVETAKIRKAKRETRGIKSLNPFIAQAVSEPKKKHGWESWRLIAKNNRDNQRYLREKEDREIPNAWWRKKKTTPTNPND